MTHDTNGPLARWRQEVRRALPAADLDLVEEIAQHITDRWVHIVAAGGDPAVADETAYEEIAQWRGRRLPRSNDRAAWATRWGTGFGSELKRAPRTFRTHPMLSAGATILSGIAVAVIVGTFVVVYGVLLRPLPYPNADRLAVIWQFERGVTGQISYPDLADVTSADVFESVSAITGGRGSLRVGDTIHRVNAISFEPSGFAMLGLTPYLGRLLTTVDADTPNAMISHRLWSTVLSADAAVVGRVLWLSGRNVTVVGVLPPGVDFELPVATSFTREKNDIWMVLERKSAFLARRDCSCYETLVRLAPAVTMRDAQAAVDTIALRLSRDHPSTNAERAFRVASLHGEVVAPVRQPLVWLSLAAAVTLLVALANLLVLGLGRWSARQAEFTIRGAIGATSFRLRRQMFCESVLIALCGGVCGAALAYQLVRALRATEAADLPRIDAIRFDGFALIVVVGLVFLITVVMTWQPMRLRPGVLHAGHRITDRHVRRWRRVLVAAEIALALVLSTGSALMTLSIVRLLAVDPGFDPGATGSARVSAYAARYPAAGDVTRFYASILDDLRAMPDIVAAGAGSSLPLSGQMTGTAVVRQGQTSAPGNRVNAGWQVMTPEYLPAVGFRLNAGRDFVAADVARQTHVTIVTESLARALFPGEDPIGRSIGIGGDESRGHWHEIVGVVDDVRHQALDTDPQPRLFDLMGQHWERTLYIAARSRSGAAINAMNAVRRVAATHDPEAPVFEIATLAMLVERSAAVRRLAAEFAVQLTGIAVLLTLIGVYAVAAAVVTDQVHEIGIRAALGASRRDLIMLVARDTLASAVCGAVWGAVGSMVVGPLIQSQLFGVGAADRYWLLPMTISAVTMVLFAAAIPAMCRALRVEPVSAIRGD